MLWILLWACLQSPLTELVVPPAAPPAPPSPDPTVERVLLVSIDTLRADAVGCLGNPVAGTPVLDGLAADGVLFTDHSTAATSTVPAHASLFTGLPPRGHGAAHNTFTLPPGIPTLAEHLSGADIPSMGVVGALPLRRRSGLARGFTHWDEPPPPTGELDERPAAAVTDAALARVDAAPAGRWLLFVHYWDPHAPYAPPGSTDTRGSFPEIQRLRMAWTAGEASPEALAALRSLYQEEVRNVDRELGRLIAGLEARGLWEGTLLVLTSDHGESMGEHGDPDELFDHGFTVYQEVAHTPLIVRQPGDRGGGRRVSEPVSLLDLLPTLLDRLGLPVPPELPGRSLSALLDGRSDAPHTPLFVEASRPQHRITEGHGWPNARKCVAVRVGAYKAMRCPQRGVEGLYDLGPDPGERQSLRDARGADAVWGPLMGLLDAAALRAPPALMRLTDPEVLEGLRGLGYVE